MKRRKIQKKINSMRKIMMYSIMGITLSAFIILIVLIYITEMIPSLNEASYQTMYNLTASSANEIGYSLNSKANSTWTLRDKLQNRMKVILDENNISVNELQGNTAVLDKFLNTAFIEFKQFFLDESVTGVFVILTSGYTSGKNAALYVNNANPNAKKHNMADLMLLRGPVRLPNLYGIALKQNWAYEQTFDFDSGSSLFFTKPMEAFEVIPNTDNTSWGYWYKTTETSSKNVPLFTYSVPLVTQDNQIFGIAGIELTLRYLASFLPENDLPFDNSFYLLGQVINEKIIKESLVAADIKGNHFLMDVKEDIPINEISATNDLVYQIDGADNDNLFISLLPLGIYGKNSEFLNENWYFISVVPKAVALSSSRQIMNTLVITFIIALLASFIGATILSKVFSGGIEKLAKEVQEIDPEKTLKLSLTHIKEIDELSQILEKMSVDIVQNASRMSTIVDLVGIPIGAFEINTQTQRVFLSDSLFNLLEIPHDSEDSQFMQINQFEKYIPQFETVLKKENNTPFLWKSQQNKEKWLKICSITETEQIYGTITDITEEIEKQERLEYENTHDTLTGLLNRNAFQTHISQRINAQPNLLGVLIFIDLDNLKKINDTYGHNMGDKYLRMAAEALRLFEKKAGIVARIAGDEFIVYLHGGSSEEILEKTANDILTKARKNKMTLPNKNIQKVQFSAGLAFYPKDSRNIEQLIKFADFAMYEVKNSSTKGRTNKFNKERYNAITKK